MPVIANLSFTLGSYHIQHQIKRNNCNKFLQRIVKHGCISLYSPYVIQRIMTSIIDGICHQEIYEKKGYRKTKRLSPTVASYHETSLHSADKHTKLC